MKKVKTTIDRFFTRYMDDREWYKDWQTTNTMSVDGDHAQNKNKGKDVLKTLEMNKNQRVEFMFFEEDYGIEICFILDGVEYSVDSIDDFSNEIKEKTEMKKIEILEDVVVNENILLEKGDVIEVLNENSRTEFLMNNSDMIKEILNRIKSYQKTMTDDKTIIKALENIEKIYDKEVFRFIDSLAFGGPIERYSADDLVEIGMGIQNRYGTEAYMILDALESFLSQVGVY